MKTVDQGGDIRRCRNAERAGDAVDPRPTTSSSPACLFPGPMLGRDGASPRWEEGTATASIRMGEVVRTVLMALPRRRGSAAEQVREVFDSLCGVMIAGSGSGQLTVATVFLADAGSRARCVRAARECFGEEGPLLHFVMEPPADGSVLAVEAWGIAGAGVRVRRCGASVLTVEYAGLRWTYVHGVEVPAGHSVARDQAVALFERMNADLALAGARFEDVVRTWLYVGGITESDGGGERYHGFNEGRAAFFQQHSFAPSAGTSAGVVAAYPASTGIGVRGRGMSGCCVALQTPRKDVRLAALENPRQTPASRYAPCHSPCRPKFSRGMALVLGDDATTWVSGTASIVNSRSVFPNDIERQTRQTLDNIESLMAPENFLRHGLPECGATLGHLARVRVYVKRLEDYARCRAVCEERLGGVPAVYVLADVCRSELLVEIEGIAFSPAPRVVSGRTR